MKGVLTLVPIPIDEISQILEDNKKTLKDAFEKKDLILVEEAKPCRKKWLHFGLPREAIEEFIIYNEHTRDELAPEILQALKKGKNAFLMSDCGLPAFCDPGVELVDLCHKSGIKVTSTSFSNSVILAVALSGFPHKKFNFEGFLSKKSPERRAELLKILDNPRMSIVMDTPYRLGKLLSEINELNTQRTIFLAMDLNNPTEELVRGSIDKIIKKVENQKREFILIIGPKNV